MKPLFSFILFLSLSFSCLAQRLITQTYDLSGTIQEDNQYGDKLAGAVVKIEGTYFATISDADGKFIFKNILPESYTIRISLLGYESIEKYVNLERGSDDITVRMSPSKLVQDEVTVEATRQGEGASNAYTNLDKNELSKRNQGQDLPYVLQSVPNLVVTSDAGTGVGYTGMRIRGSDGSRTNVTINGIPLNDAESQGTFLVDIPDMLSSTDNIQVQRGVGTSTNGAGAFGASVNIQTTKLNKEAYAELGEIWSPGPKLNIPLKYQYKTKKKGLVKKTIWDPGFTGFNTNKNTLSFGTGLIREHWAVDGRVSKLSSDGYIDRGAAELQSYFLSAGYYSNKLMVKLNHFSGHEVTYQSWNGIPEAKYKNNDSLLRVHYYNNVGVLYIDAADSANLFSSKPSKYNYYTYKGQVDNYKQDHYQLLNTYSVNSRLTANLAFHYTKGKGFFEEFVKQDQLSRYGVDSVVTNAQTVYNGDIIRRRWLDNDFYGTTFSLLFDNHRRFRTTIGGAFNKYKGRHYGEVIWSEYDLNQAIGTPYYEASATKSDMTFYAKPSFKFKQRWEFYGDLQMRLLNYKGSGTDNKNKAVDLNESLTFINPKVGANFYLNPRNTFFGFFGIANKEPNRDDYRNLAPKSKPEPENLKDLELGYRRRGRTYVVDANAYFMYYTNQLVPTGQLNDVGEPLRANVDSSYRAGLELASTIQVFPKLKVSLNAAFSRNRIVSYEEHLNSYDSVTYAPVKIDTILYKNTTIAFSPSLVAGGAVSYKPFEELEVVWSNRWVGKQFLDNTSSAERQLPSYVVNDLRISYTRSFNFLKEVTLSLFLNNFTQGTYVSNGYSYGYRINTSTPTTIRENFYYPQAQRNVLFGLNVKF